MGKHPNGTPNKKPPASSKSKQPAGPMTLGNMRSLGPRSLDVTCTACGHHTSVNVDAWPDDVPVPSMGVHMRCTKCGQLGANVRPDWTQLRGVPRTPRQ
jgi:ribosomal protein L37E